MRILIISQYFWPENFRINELSEELNNLENCNITVLTGLPNYGTGSIYDEYRKNKKNFLKYKKIKILRVPVIPRKNSYFFLFLNYISFIFSCTFFGYHKIKKKKFDKILIFGTSPIFSAIPGIIFSKIFKIPSSIWLLDLWPETIYQFRIFRFLPFRILINYIVKFIYINLNIIFVQSKKFEKKILDLIQIKKKIIYLPAWYEKIYEHKKFKLKKNKKFLRIVFAGNLGKAQNLKELIINLKKIKSNKQIKFYFIGNGRERDWIYKFIKKHDLNLRILLIKSYPNVKMPKILSCADYLMVSLKSSEPFNLTIPGKLQNYMALSKPIISFAEGVTNQLVREAKCGFAADIKKVEINNFSNLIIKNKKKQLMSINSKKFAKKNFDRTKIIKKIYRYL